MRFWDASALVPLTVTETWSEPMEDLAREDDALVVWWGSRVECASAIRRREREGGLQPDEARQALDLLTVLGDSWAEVTPTDPVRVAAERALAVHPLRAADAIQLAAAIIWKDRAAGPHDLVCLDERLRDAASREGFAVLPRTLD
jgi:predicted nucleic acid-binding protein